MRWLAKLSSAAGVALAIPSSGLVSAQAPATILRGEGEFVIHGLPTPAKPAEKQEAPKAEAPKADAPAAIVEIKPEVRVFLNDLLPQFAPQPAAAKAEAGRPAVQEIAQPTVRSVPPKVNLEGLARQLTEQLRVQMNPRPAVQRANVDALARQMIEQVRPIFRAELRLLTRAAAPSPSQRREIAIDGGKAAKEAARLYAEFQAEINQNGRVRGTMPDARKMIRDGFAEAARARLSPDQAARYQAEVEARARDQRQAVVLNLVASLDNLLILGPDQREKLRESLLANWNDRLYPSIENLGNYEGYFPNIPDDSILPCLDDRQKAAWRGVQKVNFGQSFGFGGRILDAEEDPDEKAALDPEAKP